MLGIYRIYNNVNGRSYIGSSENVETRIQSHKINMKKPFQYSKLFRDDLNEFDQSDFQIEVLKELKTANELESWENYFIGKYDSLENGYNSVLSRRRPSVNISKYTVLDEEMVTPFELAVKFKLSQAEYDELIKNEDVPHIKISNSDKRYLVSEVLTYLKSKQMLDVEKTMVKEFMVAMEYDDLEEGE